MLAGFGVRAGKMGFMLMPVLKPARTSNIFLKTCSWVRRFTQISADNRRGFQRIGVIKGAVALGGLVVVYKRLDPGSSKLARDDTVYSLADLFRGLLFSISPSNILLILSILLSAFYNLFHHSTFSLS